MPQSETTDKLLTLSLLLPRSPFLFYSLNLKPSNFLNIAFFSSIVKSCLSFLLGVHGDLCSINAVSAFLFGVRGDKNASILADGDWGYLNFVGINVTFNVTITFRLCLYLVNLKAWL